jgi:hypothetical protein
MQDQHNLAFKHNISNFISQTLELPIHTFTRPIHRNIHYYSSQGSSLGRQVPVGLFRRRPYPSICERRKPRHTSLKESILYPFHAASRQAVNVLRAPRINLKS